MHAVIRIDEVEKEGIAKVTETTTGNVTPFPMPVPGDRARNSRPRPGSPGNTSPAIWSKPETGRVGAERACG